MIGVVGGVVGGVLGLLQGAGYPGIFAIVGLESAGLPLPGETTLLAASYLAATGSLSLPLVIASAALGAIAGDSLGYLIGRKGGRRFFERYGRYVGITETKLEKADRYFARHGAKTVFFGRFVAVLRILAGPMAGASKMSYRRFLAANAAGGITWATLMGTLGFFFGKPVAAILSSMGLWALALLALYLIARFLIRRRHRLPGRFGGSPRGAPKAPVTIPVSTEPALVAGQAESGYKVPAE
jgi:membrane protein DedA with SNARE-associated domain